MAVNTTMTCPGVVMVVANGESLNEEKPKLVKAFPAT